ncbi:peptidase family C54 [Dictyocaulus viviparus]|uniref:Cysteine protease n=1 Tax=Dictyocaulus viviparus TaxID=29172 RepID=A0A0D8XWP3_DICVI|nr:peptidase family C54 [Dictyocaulus viviparus]
MHFSDGNYSSEGAQIIVLLGQFYYPEGDDNVNGTSFLDFCRDYYSRIWMTYRTGMPAFLGSVVKEQIFVQNVALGVQITSDCGWGCMIRTTQMALAQAIVVNQMTREWRFKKPSSMNEFRQQARSDPYASTQVEILRLFEDCHSAPLGIHKILEISKANNSVTNPIGRWYAPSEVLSLVRKALNLSVSPLTSDLSMLLALDGQVFIGDIERECLSWSKRLLLFVPLRLGTVCVNSLYNYHVRQLLSLKTCLGILGGKPHHSLYFIGCFGDDMIYLDPHVAQEYVPISTWDEDLAVNKDKNGKVRKHPLTTFHCRLFSKIAMKEMDPSCVVGFIFKSREELDESFRILNLNHVVDVDTGPEKIARRCKDPLFSVHYEEVTNNYSHYSVTDEERQNALEHGFEML